MILGFTIPFHSSADEQIQNKGLKFFIFCLSCCLLLNIKRTLRWLIFYIDINKGFCNTYLLLPHILIAGLCYIHFTFNQYNKDTNTVEWTISIYVGDLSKADIQNIKDILGKGLTVNGQSGEIDLKAGDFTESNGVYSYTYTTQVDEKLQW